MKHASLIAITLSCVAALATESAYRYSAPITVQGTGPFVQLPLPASAYGHARQASLADLRVVDARGEPVPFALLPARDDSMQSDEQLRPATLYPLPRRSTASAALGSPVEVQVQGDRISVRRLGGASAGPAPADTPGWLVDLGQRARNEPPPQALRLAWTGPAEFSATFDLDTSDTLREWRPAGSGQLLALASASGTLVQRDVLLPTGGMRFVRLVWRNPATAPALGSAQALTTRQSRTAQDVLTDLQYAASPEPAGKADATKGALHFDLGGPLPVVSLDLNLPVGTRVLPALIQGRSRADEPWRYLGSTVFYRLERDAAISRSPPMALQATARYVRVVVDERSPAPDPAQTTLVVRARLATLVFASQGQMPFALQAGSSDAQPRALPVGTLVPQLDEERPRLGHAELGAWSEVPEVARAVAFEERKAALRPWLLWTVLLVGVAGLGWMVSRLARTRPPA